MHIGTMRNTMSTCAKYGILGVPITIFFQFNNTVHAQQNQPNGAVVKTIDCLPRGSEFESRVRYGFFR
jgi:hypothetical protein